ncbi:MAG: hypothetical protein LIO56_04940 [Lachnospiraceae bacterium]|nr:hypothetical protein [Lachnospiraceae bacterium]
MVRRKKLVFATLVACLGIGTAGCGLSGGETGGVSTDKITAFVEGVASSSEESASSYVDEPAAGEAPEEAIAEEIAPESEESAAVGPDQYAYQTLNDTEKAVYDEIVTAFENREEEATISTLDAGELENAYMAVRCDHCEFFWVEEFGYVTYTRGDTVTSIDINPVYAMSAEEQEELQTQIDAEADRMLADAPVEGSDFDKALYVYKTLVDEVDYDVNAADSQTIVSAFIGHATVCQGYSYATQYLLDRLDIPCSTVTGTADGESHAWNLVFLDGAYYYIDTTWGNSRYINRNDEEAEEIIPYKYVDYDYFGMTTEMLLKTHQPDGTIPLPTCEAVADNYYVHEGLYIDTWDPDRIGEIFRQGYETGSDLVRIRFADDELYEQAIQYFLDDGAIFDYCGGLTQVKYLNDTGNEVIVVVF